MGQNGITVLVVEDEVPIRMDIAAFLENEGFTVHEASTADDAVSLVNVNPDIRVMVTDIDMPGTMDGLNLAAAVRDRWPPVQIIITSGHRQRTDLRVAFVRMPTEARHSLQRTLPPLYRI